MKTTRFVLLIDVRSLIKYLIPKKRKVYFALFAEEKFNCFHNLRIVEFL